MYKIMYIFMLMGFGYMSLSGPTLREKLIGFGCLVVNALIFWRG